MGTNKFLFCTLAFVGLLSTPPILFAQEAETEHAHLPDPEMTGAEYEAYFAGQKNLRGTEAEQALGALDPVTRMGTRNLAWLRQINSRRPANQQLSFTGEATQIGYPITSPMIYNETIALDKYNTLVGELPDAIKRVVVGNDTYTDSLPLAEAEYLEWGRKIDRVYSLANRWMMMSSLLPSLAGRKNMDVRGYYYLQQEPNLANKLANWDQLASDEKTRLRPLLQGLCENRDSTSTCQRNLSRAETNRSVPAFHAQYLPAGRTQWEWFFSLNVRRSDVTWRTNPFELRIPFKDPNEQRVRDYLMNIEDEWRWPASNWSLKLDFQNGSGIPQLTFQPGVTPHVNGLGGNTIVMDSNQPLTEYDSRWTIRHEFGHVLGFKDCYVEFYDSGISAIVTYQIDVNNLMCSRRGKLQEKHLTELTRIYQRRRAAI